MTTMLDLLIKNASILDGTGEDAFLGNIGVRNGAIAFVSRAPQGESSAEEACAGDRTPDAARTIDAAGLTACPGFIDAHSHADLTLETLPKAENFLMQGITTTVGGHCGMGIAPIGDTDYVRNIAESWGCRVSWNTFGEWLDRVDSIGGLGVNYVPLAAHNALRGSVVGSAFTRESTREETEQIVAALREALDAGAFGMSVSLDAGVPGHFAGREEILALLHQVAGYGAVFAPHTRHHQNQWPSSRTDETAYGLYNGPQGETVTGRYHGLIEVLDYASEVPGLNMMISHLTPIYLVPHPHPAYVDDAIRRATLEEIVDRPRAAGLNVSFNALPVQYSIGYSMNIADTFLPSRMLLPEWLRGLSRAQFVQMLGNPGFRKELTAFVLSGRFKFDMINPATDPYWCREFVIHHCKNKSAEGKTVFELAVEACPHNRERAIYHTALEILYDLAADDPEASWYFSEDRRVDIGQLVHPMGMVATDVYSFPGSFPKGRPLPEEKVSVCAYNAVPYYLERLVKKDRLLSLPEAVRKLTSLPADVLGIEKRGRIAEGFRADITLLDWDSLATSHDFDAPATHTRGMEYVVVNGDIAYEKGVFSKTLSGGILRKKH